MAAYNVNRRCEDCTFADAFGRSCKHGLLFPVMVLMTYGYIYKCPNFENKTKEQLEEKIKAKELRRKYSWLHYEEYIGGYEVRFCISFYTDKED